MLRTLLHGGATPPRLQSPQHPAIISDTAQYKHCTPTVLTQFLQTLLNTNTANQLSLRNFTNSSELYYCNVHWNDHTLSYFTRQTDLLPVRRKPRLPRHYGSMLTVTSHTDIESNVPVLQGRIAVSDRPLVSCRHTVELSCLHLTATVVCLPKNYDFKGYHHLFMCAVVTTFVSVSVLRSNEADQGLRYYLRARAHIVRKFRRNRFACPWAF